MVRTKKAVVDYKEFTSQLVKEKYFSLLIGLSVFFVSIAFLITVGFKNNFFQSRKIEKNTVNKETERKQITYQVQEGDYLWLIAEKFYGDGNQWPRIAEYNHLVGPTYVNPGDVIIIPK